MPEITHMPSLHVAFVTAVGPYRETMPGHFAKLFAWLEANHVQPVGPSLGIFYDDPEKVKPEKARSDLCAPVAAGVVGSGDVQTKDIGDMEVATIVYQGEQNMGQAYGELYDWLHAQGYRDSGAPIETYLSKLGEELRAQVAVPIRKARAKSAPGKPAAQAQAKAKRSRPKSKK